MERIRVPGPGQDDITLNCGGNDTLLRQLLILKRAEAEPSLRKQVRKSELRYNADREGCGGPADCAEGSEEFWQQVKDLLPPLLMTPTVSDSA